MDFEYEEPQQPEPGPPKRSTVMLFPRGEPRATAEEFFQQAQELHQQARMMERKGLEIQPNFWAWRAKKYEEQTRDELKTPMQKRDLIAKRDAAVQKWLQTNKEAGTPVQDYHPSAWRYSTDFQKPPGFKAKNYI